MLQGGGWRGGDRAPTWLPSPRLHTPTWRGADEGRVSPPRSFSPPTPCPGPVFVHSVQGRVHSLAWPQHVNPAQAPRRQHALACDLRPLLRVTTFSEPQFPRP